MPSEIFVGILRKVPLGTYLCSSLVFFSEIPSRILSDISSEISLENFQKILVEVLEVLRYGTTGYIMNISWDLFIPFFQGFSDFSSVDPPSIT